MIAGTLYALTTHGDEAKAASQTFPVSTTSCADALGAACTPTTAVLNTDDTTYVVIERGLTQQGSEIDDDLSASFDLSSIPAGSTVNSATLTVVSAASSGPSGTPSLWLASSGDPAFPAYNGWGLNPGAMTVTSSVAQLLIDVQGAAGGTFTVRSIVVTTRLR